MIGGLLGFRGSSDDPVKLGQGRVTSFERHVGGLIHAFTSGHPCIGARQLGPKGRLYFALYPSMSGVASAMAFLRDLDDYFKVTDSGDPIFKSFVAIFWEPIPSASDFAAKFWEFAQLLNRIDALTSEYDPSISADPTDPTFELSLKGRAIFPATLHPAHPRPARCFTYPAWAMNQSAQFGRLREDGIFETWQKKIRAADIALDPSGMPNPLLADHGDASAAAQLGQMPLKNYPFQAYQNISRQENLNSLLAQARSEGCDSAIINDLQSLYT